MASKQGLGIFWLRISGVVMISRVVLAALVFQAILLAGFVGFGVAVYQFKSDADSADNAVVMASGADAAPTAPGVGLSESRANASPEALDESESMRRMELMEGKIAELGELVATLAVEEAPSPFPWPEMGEPQPELSPAEYAARVDLRSRFSSEGGTSEWGESAAAAIDNAFLTAATERRFFIENGGAVAADCRESVCSLSWAPTNVDGSQLSVEEKAMLLDRAKWELISLAGEAQGAGQLRVFMDAAADPPTIDVMVDHDAGGNENISNAAQVSDGYSK